MVQSKSPWGVVIKSMRDTWWNDETGTWGSYLQATLFNVNELPMWIDHPAGDGREVGQAEDGRWVTDPDGTVVAEVEDAI